MPLDFDLVRDPLWNTIRLDPLARRILDTPTFQRLRYVRQLGWAFLVYPGATHTRFDHALGVYHLARRVLGLLRERGMLAGREEAGRDALYAALLHDVAHYPFSHALEELDAWFPPHESVAEALLRRRDLADALADLGADAPARLAALVTGRSDSPLQNLVASGLDLDKIEYLVRDARACGVPYAAVDVDRLLHAFVVLPDPATGRAEVGLHEKGLAALESLLFAKVQMFRNVYWHHAVRAATVLFQRTVEEAVIAGLVRPEDAIGQTDEGWLHTIEVRAATAGGEAAARLRARWLPALRHRRLPKRALEVPGWGLRGRPAETWLGRERAVTRALEERWARELALPPGGVIVDAPVKPRMLELDLLVEWRGRVVRLGAAEAEPTLAVLRVADELYDAARCLRVFTVERRRLPEDALRPWLELSLEEARDRLEVAPTEAARGPAEDRS
jgi:HD superfamily phosphohydrolase